MKDGKALVSSGVHSQGTDARHTLKFLTMKLSFFIHMLLYGRLKLKSIHMYILFEDFDRLNYGGTLIHGNVRVTLRFHTFHLCY